MSKLSFVSILLLTLSVLTACDDDPRSGSEYDGFYQVTLYQERAACDDGEPWLDTDPVEPYFKLKAQSFFGTPIIGWISCSGATVDTCDDDTIDLMNTFSRKDGVWQQYMTTSSSGGGTTCWLTWRQGLPALTETGLTITVTQREAEITLEAGEECDPELVDKYWNQMDCVESSRLEATLL